MLFRSAADARMRAMSERVMAAKIAELEKKGVPAKRAFAKMKELSAKHSSR